MKSTATIILIVIVSVICLVLVGSVFSWIGAHNGLVNREEVIPQAESSVNATRATMVNKLANVLNILYNTYDSSYLTQVGVAEARNQYDKAQASGNEQDMIDATSALVFAVNAVQENPPALGFTEAAQTAMSETSEAFNLYLQAIRDYNTVVKNYNTYRRQMIFPMIIANVENFAAYQVYEVPDAEQNNSLYENLKSRWKSSRE